MNSFQEKRAARADKYRELARAMQDRSSAGVQRSMDMLRVIPMGQPILVGHHSERSHRSLIERSDNVMRNAIKASETAHYYDAKAKAIENNTAIFSADPDALDLLNEKLDKLKKLQEKMKLINKAHAAYLKNKETGLNKFPELTEAEVKFIINYVPGYSWEKHPYPSYRLTNNGATIRNVEQRIKQLSAKKEMGNKEMVIAGVKVIHNVDDDRLQLEFPDKPSEAIRTMLKSKGFRWSPSNGVWQSYLNNQQVYRANEILEQLK